MSKAILVLNMPKSCGECKLHNDSYDYHECIVTGETQGYKFNTFKNKMGKCPLKEVPEKEYADTGIVEVDEFAGGWNACIDEILGEK